MTTRLLSLPSFLSNMNSKQVDFPNPVGNHTKASLPSKTHSLQAFCSGSRDIDEPPTVSGAYTAITPISLQYPLTCDVISMRTCYSSILSPWNSRAITCMRTWCVPGPLLHGRGLGRMLGQYLYFPGSKPYKFSQYILCISRYRVYGGCQATKLNAWAVLDGTGYPLNCLLYCTRVYPVLPCCPCINLYVLKSMEKRLGLSELSVLLWVSAAEGCPLSGVPITWICKN